MPFDSTVKEDALVSCGRHCCICHKFCGTKIEVHHIREESEGGDNTAENAIPLCFDCHADMRSYDHKHPKGNKLSESELKRHRDSWYKKVEGNIGIANREEVVETDKQVYSILVGILPWNGSISFIRTSNFAGFSFEKSRLNDLHDFLHYCHNNPAFEFLDPDLEGLRVLLMQHISIFTHTVAKETFPMSNLEFNSIPVEWEDEQPERFERVMDKIHSTGQDIIDTYENLVKTATRKLGMLPDKMEEKKRSIEEWSTQSQQYELKEIATGVYVYALKETANVTEPIHYLCPKCYNNNKKSILQFKDKAFSGTYYICNECNTEICDHSKKETPPDYNQNLGGGPNSWMGS